MGRLAIFIDAGYSNALARDTFTPTQEEKDRMSRTQSFFTALRNLNSFSAREGRLVHRGNNSQGQPIHVQKGVDLLLGLEFALLSAKHQITHAAVVSGDSDLIPAFDAAQQEGIKTWLIHGPTYASELWQRADDRFLLTPEFMGNATRQQP